MNRFKLHDVLREEAGDGGEGGGGDGGGGGGAPAAPNLPPTVGTFTDLEGRFNENWVDNLPEHMQDYKNELSAKGFPAVTDMAQSYVELQRKLGASSNSNFLQIPKEGETDESVINAFRAGLGVPEKAEGYGMDQPPSDMPDGMEWNAEFGKEVGEIMHKYNVPAAAANEFKELQMKFEGSRATGEESAYKASLEKEQLELRKEWGDDYDLKRATVRERAFKAGINADEDPAFASASMVKFAYDLMEKMGEDVAGGDPKGGARGAQSASDQIKDIINNPSNPHYAGYHDESRSGPAFEAVQREVQNLSIKDEADKRRAMGGIGQ